ncbi:CBS domain-containing protein, partial [Yaniella sp.]|uniref:CBS domain-containing protein n=1 Tax=Yaniella sp. TaxID=2773929 RepID=UPI0026479DDA
PERDVEHAVMPWSSIHLIRPEATIAEVRTMMATAHTRYPVLDEDNIPVGVVHLLDVLATDNRSDPVTVPPVMMLPQAQARMVQAGSKVACVVDEYGRLDGIVTLEDLAEEVVGELTDEHDLEVPELIQEHGHASWRISGDAPIDEVEREIGHELPRGDFETISGMLIDHLKDLSEGPSKHSHPTATVAV